MQSTGQTSTQELSFWPMQGSAITYAIWRANLANGCWKLVFSHGDYLSIAPRARQTAGGEAGGRSAAGSARAVLDRALPGPDSRGESRVRPGDVGPNCVRGGRERADAFVGRAAGASPEGAEDRHPLCDPLVEARHDLGRRSGPRGLRPGSRAPDRQPRDGLLGRRLHHEHPARSALRRRRAAGVHLRRQAARARPWRATTTAGPKALLLEVGQVSAQARGDERGPDGLLGAQRLPQRRRSVARTAALVLAT